MMEIRPIRPGDEAGLACLVQRIPEADRTFLKEDVTDPDVVVRWSDLGDARSIAIDDGEVVGYVAVVPLAGWSDHVGEVRLVVAPQRRGAGLGRALARWALLQALDCGLRKLYVEVVAEQEGAVAMFTALGFRAEGLLHDHVRDRDARLRDLVLLAHPVQEQWEAMSAAGIADALEDG
jgi:L-amino acid N-acyltransferase YncA